MIVYITLIKFNKMEEALVQGSCSKCQSVGHGICTFYYNPNGYLFTTEELRGCGNSYCIDHQGELDDYLYH